jgi:hypothetical protein
MSPCFKLTRHAQAKALGRDQVKALQLGGDLSIHSLVSGQVTGTGDLMSNPPKGGQLLQIQQSKMTENHGTMEN